ncbi:hypothetical protein GGD65_008076 [Bradyrhizobium sp. CIR18]|uniref:bifunctional DNA primase/polymerase n=1 Tax=Bradyrhizobium sp. CIR18 TaxID=2663839 RepID=UPI001606E529|nr:bifunctional DNA primase/polymerase [Bradyrhizobium sp. CIR18]MBB4367002.1 hypothetical protein [Bradyrhizobium sp. CIR18]
MSKNTAIRPLEQSAPTHIVPLTTVEAAVHYSTARGFHCYPLRPGTRTSYLSFKTTGRKWGATNDPAMLARMFARYRDAELCIVTGELSGVFVLDVDMPKSGKEGRNGPESLARLVSIHGPLPSTLTARTPSGGTHYFFEWPGYYVKNSVGRIGAIGPISSGLDIRGDGGMVVAAPSKGRVWLDMNHPIVPAPQWLLDQVRDGFDLRRSKTAGALRARRTATHPRQRDAPDAEPVVVAMMRQSAGHGLSAAPEDNSDEDMFLKIYLALKVIPPEKLTYLDWFTIGAAIYNELREEERYGSSAFDLFHEWTKTDGRYDTALCEGEPRGLIYCREKWQEIVTYRAVGKPARFGKIDTIAKRFDTERLWRDQYYTLIGRK